MSFVGIVAMVGAMKPLPIFLLAVDAFKNSYQGLLCFKSLFNIFGILLARRAQPPVVALAVWNWITGNDAHGHILITRQCSESDTAPKAGYRCWVMQHRFTPRHSSHDAVLPPTFTTKNERKNGVCFLQFSRFSKNLLLVLSYGRPDDF